ncbi:aminotransferase class I/II-fold pyridoxal phosphate-dependent enzyme [candidate division NPL-UPA2 bacterium]|nr:aminotransferase class I/II-fold pyridoxal phosphate-dependent enzyme [candidate division NPL-UPA2 bacterium]
MIKTAEADRISHLPPYMFGQINEEKLAVRRRGVDMIDLGMGNPDRPPADHIIEKLCQAAHDPKAHRYSASKGITHLCRAISEWYEKRFGVNLDPEKEVVATIGSKEGISHLALAILNSGDVVLAQDPTYPAYLYSVAIAGGSLVGLPLTEGDDFLSDLAQFVSKAHPKPKVLILSYPHNPTTQVVDLNFFQEIVRLAKKENLIVIHDLAYSELCFDGYKAPSFLQAKGAKEVGIEFYSMSKSYNMAGWRVGFALGNKKILEALAKIKGYYDYGMFTPVQVASIVALRGSQKCVEEIVEVYRQRRDVLVKGLNRIGWPVSTPLATMYVWAPVPDKFKELGSLKFSSLLLKESEVAVAPGIGFGKHGEGYVRFALVENEHRLRQAVRGIKKIM